MDELLNRGAFARKAWEDYMVNGRVHQGIRPEIIRSWKKSREFGIDPFMKHVPVEKEWIYQKYLEENRFFLEDAEKVIQQLRGYVESSALIQLFDFRGMIIKSYGNSQMVAKAETFNNIPGGLWVDHLSGTNAVGLAIEHKKPFMVVGAEHYAQFIHDWTCLAFPIFNGSNRNIIGVLDVTGPAEVFSPHTFGLVQAGAYAIEKMIDQQNIRMDFQLLDIYVQQVSRGMETLMIINRYRTIIRCTEKAASLFGGTQVQWTGVSANGLGIPELSRYMDSSDEAEVEFYTSLPNETDVRIVLKRIYSDNEFLGWVLHVFPVQRTAKTSLNYNTTFDSLVGRSTAFVKVVNMAKKVADSQANVLLLGETGTGKELFARAIHHASSRKKGPFIAINCGTIPKELIASELFGYEEGTFTGAKKGGAKGKFELANGGTIFLDEIGELPLEQQVYLLRVLQERTVRRIGGSEEIPVDVRVISATHVDLAEAVRCNLFREDLYFRLNILPIRLPPLRERGYDDIKSLTNHFIMLYNRREGKNVKIDDEVLQAFAGYSWPGNVRELENTINRLIVLANGDRITIKDLEAIQFFSGQLVRSAEGNFHEHTSSGDQVKNMNELEKEQISKAIKRNGGNMSAAAKELGMSRSTLYRKIEKYQL